MYFPHSSVNLSFYETLKQQGDSDKSSRLATVLEINPFIKFQGETSREEAISQLKEVSNQTD